MTQLETESAQLGQSFTYLSRYKQLYDISDDDFDHERISTRKDSLPAQKNMIKMLFRNLFMNSRSLMFLKLTFLLVIVILHIPYLRLVLMTTIDCHFILFYKMNRIKWIILNYSYL